MPSESLLSEMLSEFARTMVTDFPIQGILDRLVRRSSTGSRDDPAAAD